jgi:competence protein ComEA
VADPRPPTAPPPLPRPQPKPDWRETAADHWEAAVAWRSSPSSSVSLLAGVAAGVVALVAFGAWVAFRGPPAVPAEDLLPLIQPTLFEPTPTLEGLLVHVAGAVAAPGVHQLTSRARVIDAVDAAGGATGEADLDRLNLAEPLIDGARVYVPFLGEQPPAAISPSVPASRRPGSSTVDLNTATAGALEALPGVGPATAAAIVSHRDEHGPFGSVDDLDDVAGIGPAKLEQIRPLISVR